MGFLGEKSVRHDAYKTDKNNHLQLLSDSQNGGHFISRRRLIGKTALGAASAIGLASIGLSACGDGKPEQTPIPTRPALNNPPTKETSPTPDEGKRRLNEAIEKLPSSIIKDLLISRLSPMFKVPPPPTPFQHRSGDFEFTVYGSQVTIDRTGDLAHITGHYQALGVVVPAEITIAPEKGIIKLPLNDQIVSGFGPPNSFANYDFKKDQEFGNGVYPLISVITAPEFAIPPAAKSDINTVENFLLVKEACSILLILLLAEETYDKAKENGIPTTHLNITKTDGKLMDTDMIFPFIYSSINNGGRTLAGTDIGGALLAHKAFQGTPEQATIKRLNKTDGAIIDSLPSITIGDTPSAILNNTLKWSLDNNPWAADLKTRTQGNITKVP